jgi:hypothetical protein
MRATLTSTSLARCVEANQPRKLSDVDSLEGVVAGWGVETGLFRDHRQAHVVLHALAAVEHHVRRATRREDVHV